MKMFELRPDLRMVLDSGPGQAYLLRHGSKVVLIDTGIAGQGADIAATLRDRGLDRDAVTHVLLTHWHPDHAGSAAEVSEWPGVQVWAHQADAPIIRGDSYGSFPHLTHTEEGFYAQIAGSVPDAPRPAWTVNCKMMRSSTRWLSVSSRRQDTQTAASLAATFDVAGGQVHSPVLANQLPGGFSS